MGRGKVYRKGVENEKYAVKSSNSRQQSTGKREQTALYGSKGYESYSVEQEMEIKCLK